MTSEAPKRRFAPMPVETSTKSNRPAKQDDSSRTKSATPRRFAVEPVETSVKRSTPSNNETPNGTTKNGTGTSGSTKPPRKFAIEPVETSTRHNNVQIKIDSPREDQPSDVKKPRKFAVQPVETSSKSNRQQESETQNTQVPRKFAVQPVEETSSSSKDRSADHKDKPKSRFAPQPVEVTERRRRSNGPRRRDSELDETPADAPVMRAAKRPARKFAVDLIDTGTRSRKASDEKEPIPNNFRTDVVPGHMVTANGEALFPAAQQIKRLPLPHERRKERAGSCGNVRSHSFLAPDLETIESSESDASEAGSPLRSRTPSAAHESPLTVSEGSTESYKRAIKAHEAEEEKYSQYMTGLEAQRAEQTLREQVLAAFPNSDFHEPVEHYVNNDDNESEEIDFDDRPATWEGHDDDDDEDLITPKAWRQATSKIDWELEEMKKHHEQLEKSRAAALLAASKKTEAGPSPWWNAAASRDFAKAVDPETSAMRDRARPPMLGSDLTFPRSQSPEPARFDITQGSHALRSQMCYLTEQAEARNREPKTVNGLWGGAPSPIRPDSQSKGLWAGLCAASRQNSDESSTGPALPSGLVTPAVFEKANPFDEHLAAKVTSHTLRPPTPPHSRTKMQKQGHVAPRIDSVLNTDEELDELMETEYPDTFVTQVFNYLSLGYPSLARPFDEELAKISNVPVSDLRQDDAVAKKMPKGYIRIGDDFEGRNDGSSQELEHNKCARWRALKLYIREWARQEKGMVHVQPVPFGTAPRRGSWAW
ncbi:hypothetical protein C1H76_2250 [Elsinoe australis]|uniref:Uncharacterized protein n=1 Tax=Elsinoe australis TaxID=40998 RepID=A0A4U7B872_9PEZI|nr:hypothetical protein C1H76_2250 [Elsinoe australis]